MSLGSIYEPEDGQRGRDLKWELEVRPDMVGHPNGIEVQIPDRLLVKDAPERARRTILPQDPEGAIILRLPAQFRSGSALRLRGYGEAREGGASGDLYLVVKLSDRATGALVHQPTHLARRESDGPAPWILVAAGAIAALLGSLFIL